MPRKRDRGPRRKTYRNGINSPRVLRMLFHGNDWRFMDTDLGDHLPEDLLREAWDVHRDWLMERRINGTTEHDAAGREVGPRPGCRPWAWWKYDAEVPEPRPEICSDFSHDGQVYCTLQVHVPGEGWIPERDYLRRHPELLAEAELLALAATAPNDGGEELADK